ncbi:hypothetical protein ACFX1T_016056 [Malus domestica]
MFYALIILQVNSNPGPEQSSLLKKIVLAVVYHLGLIYAREHAGLAASVAAVFLRVPPAIKRPARVTPASLPTAADANCDGACVVRCSKSSRPNMCHRACGTCCWRCFCVPPGTFGNYDVCPCYRDMTTCGGIHKCP